MLLYEKKSLFRRVGFSPPSVLQNIRIFGGLKPTLPLLKICSQGSWVFLLIVRFTIISFYHSEALISVNFLTISASSWEKIAIFVYRLFCNIPSVPFRADGRNSLTLLPENKIPVWHWCKGGWLGYAVARFPKTWLALLSRPLSKKGRQPVSGERNHLANT